VNVMTLQVNGNALTACRKSLWREMEEVAPDLVASGHAPLVARAVAAGGTQARGIGRTAAGARLGVPLFGRRTTC